MESDLVTVNGLVANAIPFPHVSASQVLSETAADAVLTWFETEAPWKFRSEDDFYETWDVNLQHVALPADLSWTIGPQVLRPIRELVAEQFGVSLLEPVEIHAQKLMPGFRIGVHTDFGRRRQTHRLVIQLNRGWSLDLGGLLMLFDRANPNEAAPTDRYYLPVHRSGVLFEISPGSHHAVSRVAAGERYTLVYSFFAEGGYSRFEGRFPPEMFDKD